MGLDTKMTSTETRFSAPQRIGGWLDLWLVTAVYLASTILINGIGTLPSVHPDIWALAGDSTALFYHPLFKPLLIFSLTSKIALLMYFCLWVVPDFVKLRQRASKMIVAFLLAYLIALALERSLWIFIGQLVPYMPLLGEGNPIFTKQEIVAGISCLIWVPYFLLSRRVRVTFVNGASEAGLTQLTEQEGRSGAHTTVARRVVLTLLVLFGVGIAFTPFISSYIQIWQWR